MRLSLLVLAVIMGPSISQAAFCLVEDLIQLVLAYKIKTGSLPWYNLFSNSWSARYKNVVNAQLQSTVSSVSNLITCSWLNVCFSAMLDSTSMTDNAYYLALLLLIRSNPHINVRVVFLLVRPVSRKPNAVLALLDTLSLNINVF
jgi:hypothetical protein